MSAMIPYRFTLPDPLVHVSETSSLGLIDKGLSASVGSTRPDSQMLILGEAIRPILKEPL